jgi:hypothetical protein
MLVEVTAIRLARRFESVGQLVLVNESGDLFVGEVVGSTTRVRNGAYRVRVTCQLSDGENTTTQPVVLNSNRINMNTLEAIAIL